MIEGVRKGAFFRIEVLVACNSKKRYKPEKSGSLE